VSDDNRDYLAAKIEHHAHTIDLPDSVDRPDGADAADAPQVGRSA
jgi:hypothetical protein